MPHADTLPAALLGASLFKIGELLRQAGELASKPLDLPLEDTEALAARCRQVGRELEAIPPTKATRALHERMTEAAALMCSMASALVNAAVAAREYRTNQNPQELARLHGYYAAAGAHFDQLSAQCNRAAALIARLRPGGAWAFWRR